MLAAGLTVAGDAAIVVRRPGRTQAVARETRAAARVAAEVGAARETSDLAGVALEHAHGAIGVAMATIEMLTDRGWRAVAGDGPGVATARALGREAVAERTESFDPLEVALGGS
jgi:hypothetical protein